VSSFGRRNLAKENRGKSGSPSGMTARNAKAKAERFVTSLTVTKWEGRTVGKKRQPQIPFGDDNKKGPGKDKTQAKTRPRQKQTPRQRQRPRQRLGQRLGGWPKNRGAWDAENDGIQRYWASAIQVAYGARVIGLVSGVWFRVGSSVSNVLVGPLDRPSAV